MILKKDKTIKILDEEMKKLIILGQSGDKLALEKLYLDNINLIRLVAQKYRNTINSRFDFEDLMQEAYIGFVKAVNNYDFSLNNKFSTFAVVCMENNIKNFLRQNSVDLKITSMFLDQSFKLKKGYHDLLIKKQAIPTTKELAEETGMSLNEINQIQNVLENALSLDEYYEFKCENNCTNLHEVVSNQETSIEEMVEQDSFINYILSLLKEILLPNWELYKTKELYFIFEFERLYNINKKNPNLELETKINEFALELFKINCLDVKSDKNILHSKYKRVYKQLMKMFVIINKYSFFKEKEMSAKEIGNYLGISQQRVSKIEINTLKILRNSLTTLKKASDEEIKKYKK